MLAHSGDATEFRVCVGRRFEPEGARRRELLAVSRALRCACIDQLLKGIYHNKAKLLRVLDNPATPLHTNGAENDIRCQVTKRKISGGTRGDVGRDCRDAFLSIARTCSKLGIDLWDYLGARLRVDTHPDIPNLAELLSRRYAMA